MRYLGIDFGTSRIGIAFSDEDGKIAFPKKVITNRGLKRFIKEIRTIMNEEKISEIVVGLPISFDGGDTEITKEVRRFAEAIKKSLAVPIHLENEMLTTHQVLQAGVKKEHTDEAAAALILQSFLDKVNRKNVRLTAI